LVKEQKNGRTLYFLLFRRRALRKKGEGAPPSSLRAFFFGWEESRKKNGGRGVPREVESEEKKGPLYFPPARRGRGRKEGKSQQLLLLFIARKRGKKEGFLLFFSVAKKAENIGTGRHLFGDGGNFKKKGPACPP